MGDSVSVGHAKNERYFKGLVIILVNELTQGSGEYHVMAFQTTPKVITFGTPTAGSIGNVSTIVFTGGINKDLWNWCILSGWQYCSKARHKN